MDTLDFKLRNTKLLVACSGGADSIFLAENLLRRREKFSLQLGIAHIEHGLRGAASEQDALFVKAYAAERGVPYFERRLELHREKATQGIEALARKRRYEALESICLENAFSTIATAHHLDDQIETVLLRVLQGAAPRHWLGIEEIRPLRRDSPIRLLRPLLGIRREYIRSWLKREEIPYREDKSNRDLRFLRNRLRAWLANQTPILQEKLGNSSLELQQQAARLESLESRLRLCLLQQFTRRFDRSLVIDLKKMPPLPHFFLQPIVEKILHDLGGRAPVGTVDAICKLWSRGESGNRAFDPTGIEIKRIKYLLQFLSLNTADPCVHISR